MSAAAGGFLWFPDASPQSRTLSRDLELLDEGCAFFYELRTADRLLSSRHKLDRRTCDLCPILLKNKKKKQLRSTDFNNKNLRWREL